MAAQVLPNLGDQAQEAISKLIELQKHMPGELPHVIEALRVLRILPAAERHNVATTVPFVTPSNLQRHMPELQLNIDLQLLLQYLISDEFLTSDEQHALSNHAVPYSERIQSLVFYAGRKGPEGPTRLLQCIRRSVLENGRAASGHAFVDEVLSKDSCTTEQMSNSDTAIRQYQKVDISKNAKFAKITTKAWKELHWKEVDDELKVYIDALDVSLVSDSDKVAIQSANSTREIFHVLSKCSWNYRETGLLTIIVEEFCGQDSELARELHQYNQELQDEQLTMMASFEAIQPEPDAHHEPNGKAEPTGRTPPPTKKKCLDQENK